ncbi:MAG: acyl-CoA dehydrogenase family protein [Clostridium cadaveris]|uniref:Acyl-CoA dehydrogenase n=3 Tax=Clostridium cadaveris TaxID=1529 RepID=A0A1I2PS90_9CLOT|nr:acyl-CoA dehydrogenase family protein [Clostridium cadaveris]MDU4953187.1 acyl-CoA dehydrogenase family protein [Clostridium sp.]MDM8311775.1 acyl-CoA dehydrogenase family protein [Clostridium cadaveris]MDY4949269.1 acyl-CoA dehydrogenase family protein [Clostridium cadaveris]NWK09691.1 acyl-CoA dehydrogenase family protein [Clostridium cadaveris]PWL55708.1 MAG: acyl-CoA dehydrogenase [Clostridium cadaveris]
MYFTEQHELIRKLAREFAEKELTSEILDKVEETGEFPQEILDKMARAGFFGIKVPKELGGQGADSRAYVIVMEEIARVSGVASIYVSSPNSLSGGPLQLSGNDDQKEKYLRPVVTGTKKLAFALTEPGAGSDAGGMTTTAVKDGDYYILNGRKCFITAAPLADYSVIYAKTDMTKGTRGISAFVVDMKLPGVSCGKPEHKMGLIGCATSDIILENVRVHKSDLLGEEGKGFINAMKTLDTGRMGVAAQAIGVAQGALDEAIKYAKERKQFGRRIGDFQGISFMIAEMATKLEAAKQLVYKTAYLMDTHQDASMAASMAKYFASEACNEIVAKAVQIHGGYGFIKDYKVERMYRDCRVFTIYEGTSQVQQMVIAGKLLKK